MEKLCYLREIKKCIMRKYLLFLIVTVVISACGSLRQISRSGITRQVWTAEKVLTVVESRHYSVDIKYMFPQRGMMKALDYGYGLRISGDSLYSYLPYFGVTHGVVPYGGGKALHFDAIVSDYFVDMLNKNLTRVMIFVVNEEDRYRYIINIYNNGNVQLSVQAERRDFISFSGELAWENKERVE